MSATHYVHNHHKGRGLNQMNILLFKIFLEVVKIMIILLKSFLRWDFYVDDEFMTLNLMVEKPSNVKAFKIL